MTDFAAENVVTIEPRFKLIAFEQLRPNGEPSYLVKGLIPRVGLILVWGPPKCGKSFWTADLLLHVALGWPYRGRRVQQGPVVYCAFEGADGYKARAEAFRIRFLPDECDRIPFYLVAGKMEFLVDHTDLIASIRAQIGDKPPIAVALDTLNRSLGGKEDDERIGGYIRAADAVREAFNCAVLIVHHSGVDKTRPRGHTSLPAAADAILAVTRDGTQNIVVMVEDMKDGPDGDTVVSRLEQVEVGTDTDGEPITSCVVVSIDATNTPKKQSWHALKGVARTARRALAEAITEWGVAAPASDHISTGRLVVTLQQWRECAYRRGISASEEPRARQQAFRRGTEQLIATGAVGVCGNYVWLAD